MAGVKVDQAPDERRDSLPVFQEMEEIAAQVRRRAFELFAGRGAGEGRALEDWLAAEREICWPAAELAEDETGYELSVSLPGFEPGEITVTAAPSELIVHALRETKSPPSGATQVQWSEFRSNDVYRRIEFARPVDVQSASATLGNGLLKVALRKSQDATRNVPVAAAA